MAEGGIASSSDRISEIRARLEALRVPTWDADDLLVFGPHPDRSGFLTTIASFLDDESAEFAARARTDIPYLLAEVERLTTERDRVYATKQHAERETYDARNEAEELRLQLAASERRVVALLAIGERLYGQVMTFAIQFHQREGHAGLFDDDTCGVGACRSTLRQMHDWCAAPSAASTEGE